MLDPEEIPAAVVEAASEASYDELSDVHDIPMAIVVALDRVASDEAFVARAAEALLNARYGPGVDHPLHLVAATGGLREERCATLRPRLAPSLEAGRSRTSPRAASDGGSIVTVITTRLGRTRTMETDRMSRTLDDEDATLRARHFALVHAWAAVPFWRPRKRRRIDAEVRGVQRAILDLQPRRWAAATAAAEREPS